VRLVQEGIQGAAQPGFLVYLPIYAVGQPTESLASDERLKGFVSGAFRARDLMDSIFGGQHWISTSRSMTAWCHRRPGLLYRGGHDGAAVIDTASTDALSQRVSLDIAGHRWLFVARPASSFLSFADRYQHWLIAAGGISINLLLGAGLWASASVRRRAVVMAEGMSRAVRVSEAQTQLMVDSITDHAIFRLDAERNVASWNASAERMLGYTRAEAIARPASRFWVGFDNNPYAARASSPSGPRRVACAEDGHRFWGAAAIAPLQQSSRESSGYVVILRDDTSRRQGNRSAG
jgi:PAS domain S-box-containing protein